MCLSYKKAITYLSILLFYSSIISCASRKLFLHSPEDAVQPVLATKPDYTIYAVGDAGEINDQSRAVLKHLTLVSVDDTHPGVILFLGDNIYPAGFPPEGQIKEHQAAKEILMNQILPVKDYAGNNHHVIFLAGNHDWNEFKPGGLDAVKRQSDFIKAFDPFYHFLPEAGCSGPAWFQNENVVLLIIDSQWWLQDWSKEPQMNDGCPIKSREDFIKSLHTVIQQNEGKQIVICMHHPLFTQGPHAGYYTLKDHLFPLTKVENWMYIPLPLIGSIYPIYRSLGFHPQDLNHKLYQSLKNEILNGLDYDGELIFLSGHEHNLQYLTSGKNHYIISGAGSKKNAIANAPNLVYGHKAGGFVQLDFYEDKGVRLTVYENDPKTSAMHIVFSRFIVEK